MRHLIGFGIVGIITTILNYCLFMALVILGLHYLLASAVGWFAGVLASYVLNRTFTFVVRGPMNLREFSSFVGVYVAQLLLAWAGYIIMIEGFQISLTPAYLVNAVVVTVFNFSFMKLHVFR